MVKSDQFLWSTQATSSDENYGVKTPPLSGAKKYKTFSEKRIRSLTFQLVLSYKILGHSNHEAYSSKHTKGGEDSFDKNIICDLE